jgi:ketosteroid isomerase-like protein
MAKYLIVGINWLLPWRGGVGEAWLSRRFCVYSWPPFANVREPLGRADAGGCSVIGNRLMPVGLACCLALLGRPAWPEESLPCATDSGLQGLLSTEYAFAGKAGASVRTAFLEYLAEDSLVLEPQPVPGRAHYTAAKENADRLEWYPSIADIAGSHDLGFTTGPWVYTAAAGGPPIHGDFLTVWKRDAGCRWRIEVDGGVSHDAPADAEPKLAADRQQEALPLHDAPQSPNAAPSPRTGLSTNAGASPSTAPSPTLVAADAVGRAISDFQGAAAGDGIPAGLRTYARTMDFRFLAEGEAPLGLAAAVTYLSGHTIHGAWREQARGRAADSSLAYSVGEFGEANKMVYAYVQVWQYDPKVANWGLRILLLNPLPPAPQKKS